MTPQTDKATARPWKMILIEGNSATIKRKFSYRGHFILSRSKSRDFRNKTHPGYDWEVEFNDGTRKQLGISSRTDAKSVIDSTFAALSALRNGK